MENMKIGIVTEYFPKSDAFEVKGGAEASAFNEAKYLAKRHDVVVITSHVDGKKKDNISGIRVIRCGRERKYVQSGSFFDRLLFMKDAYHTGCKQDFDIVVGYNFITHPVAWRLSKKLNIPSVARYHDVWIGNWIRNIGFSGIFGEILERYTLSCNFDLIIAVSDYTKDKLKRYFDETRITVVPNGVDVPSIETEKFEHPTVCCISRLVKYKRVHDLIKALSILKKDIPNIRCIIIGTGPEEENLKKLARDLGVEKKIDFCGFIEDHNDVLRTIKSSHIFCLPSVVEGFGIVIVEALACGVPFVASNIPPLIEVSGGKGGLFFEPKNYRDLADKIKNVLNNRKIQKDLIREGIFQSKKYRWNKIGGKIEDICKNLINK